MNDAGDGEDKLRHGPCSKLYIDLEECASNNSKTIRSHSVSQRPKNAILKKTQLLFSLMH